MRRALLALLALALGAAAFPSPQPAAGRRIAVTFDDLPVATRVYRDSLAALERITDAIARVSTAHRIPAIGFVNENKLLGPDGRPDPRRAALLRRWAELGLELGNHGYSHLDLHTTPLDSFQRDVARGDSVTRLVLAAAGQPAPRFFRHPFLHTGRSVETRRAFERFLAERGYRVAPVTVDNYDYVFAAAYERADGRVGRDSVRRTYLEYMERVLAYYEQQSLALFGREIPQVLLLHANALNADAFDDLAQMMERRGYEFVPLARAVADSAYASRDEYAGPAGITWLHRWALTQGKRGPFFAGEPEVPKWVEEMAR
jgi:peptidoglycan/xylan/chitin deacetylase (PgdA/CDA1 family)